MVFYLWLGDLFTFCDHDDPAIFFGITTAAVDMQDDPDKLKAWGRLSDEERRRWRQLSILKIEERFPRKKIGISCSNKRAMQF